MIKINKPALTLCLLLLSGSFSYGMDPLDINPIHRSPPLGENNIPRETNSSLRRLPFSDLKGPALKDLPLIISSSVAPFAAFLSNRSLLFARGSIFCNGAVLATQLFGNIVHPFLSLAPVFTSSCSIYFSYLYYYLRNDLENSNKNHLKKTTDWMGLEERFPKMKSPSEPLGFKYFRRGNIGFSLVTPLFLVCIAQYGMSLKREVMLRE